MSKDPYVYVDWYDGLQFFQIDAPFYVDDIRYDIAEATNELRGMFEVLDDEERSYSTARMRCSTPPSEAELDEFVTSPLGIPDWVNEL